MGHQRICTCWSGAPNVASVGQVSLGKSTVSASKCDQIVVVEVRETEMSIFGVPKPDMTAVPGSAMPKAANGSSPPEVPIVSQSYRTGMNGPKRPAQSIQPLLFNERKRPRERVTQSGPFGCLVQVRLR